MLTGIAVFVAPSLPAQLSMFAVAVAAAINVFWFESGSEASTYMNVAVLACLALAGFGSLIELGRRKLQESLLSKLTAGYVIMLGAMVAAIGLFWFRPENPFSVSVNIFVAVSLLVAGVVACVSLAGGGLPKGAGAAPDEERLQRPLVGPISAEWLTYLGTAVAIAVFVLLVSGFAVVTPDGRPVTIIPDSMIGKIQASGGPLAEVAAVVVGEVSRPAGLVLMLSGLVAFGYLLVETFRLDRIPRQRMFVVLILTFFSMLFWSFFEQAGSSVNNFTDRNVDRVLESRTLTAADVGTTIRIEPTQEQLGYTNGGEVFTLSDLDKLRSGHEDDPNFEIDWEVSEDDVGMGVAGRIREIPASTFQAVNPIYIIIFGLVFTALWAILDRFGLDPSTPVKFALGLLQLGLGFGAFWYGAQSADARGMVAISWLFVGYLLQTTGELCLSPVGLSMVTKLSPTRLVATVMGGWFLATAFSQFLAAIIAQFTGVGHGGDGGAVGIPIPRETVDVYGDVFGKIAIAAMISALICFALSPLLSRWMHTEAVHDE
jgi:POT family proton-dependent oligopeptide transporter